MSFCCFADLDVIAHIGSLLHGNILLTIYSKVLTTSTFRPMQEIHAT